MGLGSLASVHLTPAPAKPRLAVECHYCGQELAVVVLTIASQAVHCCASLPHLAPPLLCPMAQEWWNATTVGEYWRLWNQPVHKWMLRHVYFPGIRAGLPKFWAGASQWLKQP